MRVYLRVKIHQEREGSSAMKVQRSAIAPDHYVIQLTRDELNSGKAGTFQRELLKQCNPETRGSSCLWIRKEDLKKLTTVALEVFGKIPDIHDKSEDPSLGL